MYISALLLSGLSAAILTAMIKDLDGPFDCFQILRNVLMRSSFFAKWLDCYWCVSTWTALPMAIYAILVFTLPWYFVALYWLSSAMVAVIVYRIVMY
jgi:hypothetical protein